MVDGVFVGSLIFLVLVICVMYFKLKAKINGHFEWFNKEIEALQKEDKKIKEKISTLNESLEKEKDNIWQMLVNVDEIYKKLKLLDKNFTEAIKRQEEELGMLESEIDNNRAESNKRYSTILDIVNDLDKNNEKTQTTLEENCKALWDIADENRAEFDSVKEKFLTIANEMENKFSTLLGVVNTLAETSKETKENLDRHIQINEAVNLLNDEKESAFDVIKRRLKEIENEEKGKELSISDSDKTTEKTQNDLPESKENLLAEEQPTDLKEIKQEEIKKVLDIDQQKAYDLIRNTKDNIFITGKAGTGKTFLIEMFTERIDKKMLLLAPTGTAAVNINGATIHSAFGYKNLEKPLEELKVSLSSEKKEVLKNIDIIIVDEISMVRADIFDKMDKILQSVNNNNYVFGGKQIIIFGDIFQLPPVVKNDEVAYLYDHYENEFFFSSNAYKKANFKFVELKENHRQERDSMFFNILNRVREGKSLENDIKMLNERMIDEDDKNIEFVTKIYAKKDEVDRVNETRLKKLKGKENIYYAKELYRETERNYSSIENKLPIVNELKLKEEALVVITRNDPNGRWQNGTRGVVKKCDENKIWVDIGKNKLCEIKREIFEEKEAIYENGKISYKTVLKVEQFPLMLAYAMTIHKSQGATYQQIAVDVSDCFAYGQAYVALSRCRSLEGLFLLNSITLEDIMVDSRVTKFYLEQLEKQEESI